MLPGAVRSFVALVLPPEVAEPLRALQLDFRDRFGSIAALRSPPHLTLVPPFHCDRERLGEVDAWLGSAVAKGRPFELVLEGFGCFPPRVIFAAPLLCPGLSDLHQALHPPLSAQYPFVKVPRHPFHPHVTLAYKDLSQAMFHAAWEEYRGRALALRWTATGVSRLEQEGGQWQVRREFSMG